MMIRRKLRRSLTKKFFQRPKHQHRDNTAVIFYPPEILKEISMHLCAALCGPLIPSRPSYLSEQLSSVVPNGPF
ncbi:hypothetical protein SAMN02745225_02367 [Ferrithrix thermotolerans DSM 19514]|uniref:Uncharacterized protein n=1 Tax=Ferrithrix thermotolerans DSM 19514 TaxID=1121881 RepID=A0A1M4YM83_9ACTN|nr:hypothetical protein SAMN02745225_02367 [Ferrithrix thermotolerans DSM 19514]